MFKLKEIVKVTKATLVSSSGCDLLNGVSTDSRAIKKKEIFFALRGDNFDGHDFIRDVVKKGAQAVVISKKIENTEHKINILKVKDTTIALGQLAKYCREKKNIPLIAVTGSAGKTTTKDVIARILAREYNVLSNFGTHNNHIGVPQTIFKLNNKHDICVLELGTNHFGEVAYLSKIAQPQIAVITNIGASHLEFFKDLNGVFREKIKILNHLENPKIVLLNGDDSFLRRIKLPKEFKVFYFGIKKGSDFLASDITFENNRASFVFNKKHKFRLNTIGKFNIYNALAGIGCGIIFGISMKEIKTVLENFKFPERRLNMIDCSKFILFDDTYNSNPLSLRSAIESLIEFKSEGRKILVMGDMLELGNRSIELHQQIGRFIAQSPIDMLVTLGKLSKSAADTARARSKSHQNIFNFDSKPEVVSFLKSKIKSGDVLLIKGSRLMQMEDIVSCLAENK